MEDNKVYVIVYRGYWYTDEYYQPYSCENSIHHLFYNKQEAIKEWKKLELDFQKTQGYDIFAFEGCTFEMNDANLDFDEMYDRYYKKSLTDDQIHDLTIKLDRNIYELIEYPKNFKCYVTWLPNKNSYMLSDDTTEYDPYSNIALEWHSFDDTRPEDRQNKVPIILGGTLKELSDTPLLLERLIEQDQNLTYSTEYKCLNIMPHEATINSVNALLKKHFFEIQCLSIEEIFKIEQQLNQDLGW
ncbi:MAG: hypothetical protein O2793_14515 [Proteobacteria bacterium]|nr:hypothetical protein [Pseudomonadota bacterium]MDA1255240.1 hypothetical protein [Pseudomonadota bacterium]